MGVGTFCAQAQSPFVPSLSTDSGGAVPFGVAQGMLAPTNGFNAPAHSPPETCQLPWRCPYAPPNA